MDTVVHNNPEYLTREMALDRITVLQARVAELELAIEAYKAEVATCHRNEADRIRYREALEDIQSLDYAKGHKLLRLHRAPDR